MGGWVGGGLRPSVFDPCFGLRGRGGGGEEEGEEEEEEEEGRAFFFFFFSSFSSSQGLTKVRRTGVSPTRLSRTSRTTLFGGGWVGGWVGGRRKRVLE